MENEILNYFKEKIDGYTHQIAVLEKALELLATKYAEEYLDGGDVEHIFNCEKRDKFAKENIDYFKQQAEMLKGEKL